MSVFLDASVIVAILSREPEGPAHVARLTAVRGQIYVSAIVVFEATISLARKKATVGDRPSEADVAEVRAVVRDFLASIDAREIALSGEIADLAIETAARFGKIVGHPAKLNMGDCFAYACACSKNVPLLYKGDDFSHIDIPAA